MAVGVEFPGVNRHLGAPKGMHEEQVYVLPVMMAEDTDTPIPGSGGKGFPVAISRHQFSSEEMAELIKNGGKTYLKVLGGQPPVNISPFPYENLNTEFYDQNPT